MPRQVANRRGETRYEIPAALGAELLVTAPDGTVHRLELKEVSALGLAFRMPGPIDGVSKGAMIADAALRVAEFEVRGGIAVLHTTRGFGSEYTCGAMFFPKSETDRNQLVDLIAHLRKLPI